MNDKLIIQGIDGIDGTYEFSFAELLNIGTSGALTQREGHRIKVMTGLRQGEYEDALMAGDGDMMVALAAVILTRHGKTFSDDALWDSPIGSIGFEAAAVDEEDDAGPPPQPPAEPQSTPDVSSGSDTESGSESPENGQSRTGHPESVRSAISGLATLGN